ncbi:GNAT family N-acetyltransferase [Streptomyces sp. PSAA01]|uniref:GNAT family N-acetyltransferase n=1 Tax=Streptomyces sp. PSAA01 TaxID=2912762 RepID=UPI001F32D4DC|nr:GNAT family N-acetyltransferase [Streptomyces sp. PSAA01]MCG0283821.1 GNAT family N-acetyltransferase [Streptomyces sp. PSAA01]
MTPQDGAALRGMYVRCTPLTHYRRFLCERPEFPETYVRSVLSGNICGDAVLVAPAPEPDRAIALGSTHPDSHTADAEEIGILVEDAWQRTGVGTLLLRSLVDRCRLRGVRAVTAETLSSRRGLLHAVRHAAAGPSEYGALSDNVRITAVLAAGPSPVPQH